MNIDQKNTMTPRKRILRITGVIILIVSCILFILIPVVPFLGFKAAKTAAVSTGLLIAGEILFYISIFILGRTFLDKIKSWFRIKKSKKSEFKSTDNQHITVNNAETQASNIS